MSIPIDPKPWVQPLFMVYSGATDEKVPLTQERLDQLLAVEMQYGRLISSIRNSHEEYANRVGYMTKPFADIP